MPSLVRDLDALAVLVRERRALGEHVQRPAIQRHPPRRAVCLQALGGQQVDGRPIELLAGRAADGRATCPRLRARTACRPSAPRCRETPASRRHPAPLPPPAAARTSPRSRRCARPSRSRDRPRDSRRSWSGKYLNMSRRPAAHDVLRLQDTVLQPETMPLVHLGEWIGQAPRVVRVVAEIVDVGAVIGREDQPGAGEELHEVSAAWIGHIDEEPLVCLVPRRRSHHALQAVLGNPVERQQDFLAAVEVVADVIEHRGVRRNVGIGEHRDVV